MGGENPNRLFKAVSITTNPFARWIWLICHFILAVIAFYAWLVCEHYWRVVYEPEGRRLVATDGLASWGVYMIIGDQEDAIVLGYQLMVGSLMLTLHCIFQYFH